MELERGLFKRGEVGGWEREARGSQMRRYFFEMMRWRGWKSSSVGFSKRLEEIEEIWRGGIVGGEEGRGEEEGDGGGVREREGASTWLAEGRGEEEGKAVLCFKLGVGEKKNQT